MFYYYIQNSADGFSNISSADYILGETFRNQSIVGSIFEAHVKESGPQVGQFNSGKTINCAFSYETYYPTALLRYQLTLGYV